MKPTSQCNTQVFVYCRCIFAESRVISGVFESIREIINLVGVDNFYVVAGNNQGSFVKKMLNLFDFWKATGANPDKLIFFDIEEEHAQFNAIRRAAGDEKPLCVICDDYKVLQKFPRKTVRVLINHDSEEWACLERNVLAHLSMEDAKNWDTVLVTPTWHVHQAILRRFILHPESMLEKV